MQRGHKLLARRQTGTGKERKERRRGRRRDFTQDSIRRGDGTGGQAADRAGKHTEKKEYSQPTNKPRTDLIIHVHCFRGVHMHVSQSPAYLCTHPWAFNEKKCTDGWSHSIKSAPPSSTGRQASPSIQPTASVSSSCLLHMQSGVCFLSTTPSPSLLFPSCLPHMHAVAWDFSLHSFIRPLLPHLLFPACSSVHV
mmetsp:Transcript_47417/g.93516  ORF Transcript_47417/g.93516 Transcript_47417/m.93516 type:complete len:195 (-) Transcript_47417:937-1521(-)